MEEIKNVPDMVEVVDIQFRAEAALHSAAKGRHGVFRNPVAVEAPVGVVPAPELRQTGMAGPAAQGQQIQDQKDEQRPEQVFHGALPQSSMSRASRPFLGSALGASGLTSFFTGAAALGLEREALPRALLGFSGTFSTTGSGTS